MTPTSNILQRITRLREEDKMPTGVSSGMNSLDRIFGGFEKGKLYVVAGTPQIGKTSLFVSWITNILRSDVQQIQPGVFSLDIGTNRFSERMVSSVTGIWLDKIQRGKVERHEYERLVEGSETEMIDRMQIDTDTHLTMEEMEQISNSWVENAGVNILFIDYLQLIASGDASVDDAVYSNSKGLKRLATALDIPVVVNVETQSAEQTTLSELRKVGAIEQWADVVFLLKKAMDENQRYLTIAKSQSSSLETILLEFMPWLSSFESL